ncbi:MAG TPA: hypothetical protein VF743_05900 [Acidimicrobiales bacterium]
MTTRSQTLLVVAAWLVIGVAVALAKGYGDIDDGSELATFLLAVVLWPVPAFGGRVGIRF